MKRLLLAAMLLCLLTGNAFANFIVGQVFDATAAFVEPGSGALANPNGVWSYGTSASKNGVFTAYTSAQYFTQSNAFGFSVTGANGNPPHVPNILKAKQNIAGAAIGQLSMHSGSTSTNEFSVLRFTTPNAGLYNLDLTWGAGNSGAVSVYAFRSGDGSSFEDIPSTTAGGSKSFTNLSLGLNEFIELRIGRGNDGVGSDQTPVNMKLTAVPEPSSLACVSGLVAGLSVLSRRRRQA